MGRNGSGRGGECRPARVRTAGVVPLAILAGALVLASSAAWSATRLVHRSTPAAAVVTGAAPGTIVNANASSFDYQPGAGGDAISAMHFTKSAAGALTLTVYGTPPQAGSAAAVIDADLVNSSGRAVTFPGTASVQVALTWDGRPWRSIVVDRPVTPRLDPGQQVRLEATVPLPGPGHYDLSAAVAVGG